MIIISLFIVLNIDYVASETDIKHYMNYIQVVQSSSRAGFFDDLLVHLGSNDYGFGLIIESLFFLPERIIWLLLFYIPLFLIILNIKVLNPHERIIFLTTMSIYFFHNAFLSSYFHYLRFHTAFFIFLMIFFLQRKFLVIVISGLIHKSFFLFLPIIYIYKYFKSLKYILLIQIILLILLLLDIRIEIPLLLLIETVNSYSTNYAGHSDIGLEKYYIISIIAQILLIKNKVFVNEFGKTILSSLSYSTLLIISFEYFMPSGLLAARYSPILVFFVIISLLYYLNLSKTSHFYCYLWQFYYLCISLSIKL